MASEKIGLIIAVILGIVFCSALLYAVWVSAREWAIWNALKRRGQITTGKVTGQKLGAGGKVARLFVAYSFFPVGDVASVISEQQVSLRHYHSLTSGQEVKLRYLPSHPSICRLAGKDTDHTLRDGTSLMALVVVIAIFPTVLLWGLSFLIQSHRLGITLNSEMAY